MDDESLLLPEDERLLRIARQLREAGATRGMIAQRLEEHANRAFARLIADQVVNESDWMARISGAVIAVLGVAIFALAALVWITWLNPTVPIGLSVIGTIVFGVGVFNALGKAG